MEAPSRRDGWSMKFRVHILNLKYKAKGANCKWGEDLSSQSPPPTIYFLQQATPPKPPQTVPSNCGPSVQMAMGDVLI